MSFDDPLERLEKAIVKENHNIGLGFSEGYVFFRVVTRNIFPFLYDPFAEITNFGGAGAIDMASGLYITAKELPSTTLSSTNIFHIKQTNHINQIFFGISPGICRIFPAYPRQTEINQLDEGIHTSGYPIFGFIDGFESPIEKPSPRSMFFIPYGPLMAFAFYNPAPYNIKPMLQFIINRLNVKPITDVDMVMKILQGKIECRLATLGDIDGPYSEGGSNYRSYWNVDPIRLDATRAEIVTALTPEPSGAS
jgi:hypothetical protein